MLKPILYSLAVTPDLENRGILGKTIVRTKGKKQSICMQDGTKQGMGILSFRT
jgi:hypothetical protein